MTEPLKLERVAVSYDGNRVVEDISLTLEAGSIGCFLGASGCGKTSLLRAVAGFEPIVAGRILLHGREVARPGYRQPPETRQVGMVFQDFALFPHLTVTGNIGFGLARWRSAERTARVAELLTLVGLEAAAAAYPHQLSGGQQQRVALARALAPRPSILLLDEPFSNIDTERREQLALEIRTLLRKAGVTAVLVTHDQQEAFAVADRVGVLGNGRLHQWDSPYRLYHQPVNRYVADFIGRGVLIPGRVRHQGAVDTALGLVAGAVPSEFEPGTSVALLLRPDDLIPDPDGPVRLKVARRVFRGTDYLYTLELSDGTHILGALPSHHDHPVDTILALRLDIRHMNLFRVDREPRLKEGVGAGDTEALGDQG